MNAKEISGMKPGSRVAVQGSCKLRASAIAPVTRPSCKLRASAIARRRTEEERAEAFFLRE